MSSIAVIAAPHTLLGTPRGPSWGPHFLPLIAHRPSTTAALHPSALPTSDMPPPPPGSAPPPPDAAGPAPNGAAPPTLGQMMDSMSPVRAAARAELGMPPQIGLFALAPSVKQCHIAAVSLALVSRGR